MATWEDWEVLKVRFPSVLAWGQASSSPGGIVTPSITESPGTPYLYVPCHGRYDVPATRVLHVFVPGCTDEKLSLNYGIEINSAYLSFSLASFFYSKSGDRVPHDDDHTGKGEGEV
jgi:hypothetical protein